MKILVINGNTKSDGFIAGALAIIIKHLESKNVDVNYLRLANAQIQDCKGCFNCLKTGACVIEDDMTDILEKMLQADGFVVGSPVRNGMTTACYKRFYERITYTLGFSLLLENKYTLAVSSVGFAGGKSINRKLLGLQDVFFTTLSDFLFFKTGLPSKLKPDDVPDKLQQSADKLISDIETKRKRSFVGRVSFAIDRIIMRNIVFKKNPDAYESVINNWKKKNYIN
ncbi:flavodoxin family protein [bacterium]|nr:flavodoxin family protein [bacterium]